MLLRNEGRSHPSCALPASAAQGKPGFGRFAILLACLLLLARPMPSAAADADARHYTVQSWTVRDGLPHNMVHAIARDAEGYLWFATWEGAARFDGHDFAVFDTRNVQGLKSRGFRDVIVDRDGHLLFGSARSGVWRVRGSRWQALAQPILGDAWVTRLLRDRSGRLWVGTERGLLVLEADDRLRKRYGPSDGLPEAWVLGISQDAAGRIWVATDKGAYQIDADSGRVRPVRLDGLPPDTAVRAIRQVGTEVYVGTDSGLFRMQAGAFVALPPPFDRRIGSLLPATDGSLWVHTSDHGLYRLQDGRVGAIGERERLIGRATAPLFQDQEGLIWAGTSQGLFRIADNPVETLDRSRGLSDDYVRTVLAARDGSMWIGTNQGLHRWQDGRLQTIQLPWPPHQPSTVFALGETDECIWVGTALYGVLCVDKRTGRSRFRLGIAEGLPALHVRALAGDRRGGLWIGTVAGLAYRDAAGRISRPGAPAIGQDQVRSIHPAADGRTWIGIGDGLSVFERDGRLRRYDRGSQPAFPADNAFDMLDDGDGNLWIASDQGLIRFRAGRVTAYGSADGFPNPTVFRLLRDRPGELWLSSNLGVFRIERRQLDEIDAGRRRQLTLHVIDHDSGMPSSQANGNNFPAGDLDARGRLWIPTAAGVAIIDTAPVFDRRPAAVRTSIESVLLNDTPKSVMEPLTAHSGDAHRLAISFAGLSFRHIGNMRYRYRLEGFDPDWIDAGSRNQAIYTNLPAGDFRFRVQAAPRHTDWSQDAAPGEATLRIRLLPPFWQRTPFVVAASVLAALMLLTAWSLRGRRYKRQQARLRQMVEQRTSELRDKNDALERIATERQNLMHQLEFLASRDELTGLPNRRSGRKRLRALCASGQPMQVAMLDIDHFKRINDQYGHDAGDRALHGFADLLLAHSEQPENCARLGGEEFILMLPGMDHAQALAHCERLRRSAQDRVVELSDGVQLRYTVSIGLSDGQSNGTPEHMLHQADERLYRAKKNGRNQVCADDHC